MFRGFIREVAEVVATDDAYLEVHAPLSFEECQDGGAVSIAGVSLTAVPVAEGVLRVATSPETRHRSTIDTLAVGGRANIELPMRSGDTLEGHLVQGAVDGIGKVLRIDEEGVSRRVWIRPGKRFVERLASKSPIGVDGVSVTVAEVVRDRFSVALLPTTLDNTTLGDLREGDRVNLESDLSVRMAEGDANRHRDRLAALIRNLPWAGWQRGRIGVEKVVAQFAAGAMVVVWDPRRENEGDVIVAGKNIEPATFTFILTQVCGHATVPCDRTVLRRLGIDRMPGDGDHQGTLMCVPVDLAAGEGTGVSAEERAATVRKLADPVATSDDFVRPGHVFPLEGRPGGLAERAGHTEATLALCRAAELPPVGVCCEIMNPDGRMAGVHDLERFALEWGLPLVSIDDLVRYL